MTLKYQMIVDMYPFSNEVVRNSIPAVKSSIYLTDKKTS